MIRGLEPSCETVISCAEVFREGLLEVRVRCNLGCVARAVYQIPRDDDKRGLQPIHSCHREFKISLILNEALVVGEHAQLRVAQLDEEKRRFRHGAGWRRQKGDSCEGTEFFHGGKWGCEVKWGL